MDRQELDKRFSYHTPKGDQPARYDQVRSAFRALADEVNKLTPESRERSTAFTYLETAQFWFNAAIARNE